MLSSVAVIGPPRAAAMPAKRLQDCEICPARGFNICGAMRREDLDHVAAAKSPLRLAAGRTLVSEGEPATHFFNVTEGALKTYKLMPDGRRQVTGFLFAGDLLGLACDDTYTFSSEALTDASLCAFPRRQFERLLETFPRMERQLLTMASNELAAAQDQMVLLGRKSAPEKVASFLLMLAGRQERLGRPRDRLRLAMTRSDIADYLGLTTETVSRNMTILRHRGCIELEASGMVRLSDRDLLEELAEGAE